MRQRELLEFRTPQHPSLGSNNWGGASPLLARDIPKESLEQRYLKLNSIRTRDEIFPAEDEDFIYLHPQTPAASKHAFPPSTPSRRSRGLISKLIWPRKEKAAFGSNSNSNSRKKRWFPKWDPQNRWPQGWC